MRGLWCLAMNWGQRGSGLALALCWCAAPAPAEAQSATANAASRADMTPAERAQRDADKVFQWIRLQADKPAQRPPAVAKAAAPITPSPSPAVAKAAAAVERTAASTEAAAPSEATLFAAARLVTRTMAPLPAAPVAAAPEPELMLPLKLLSKVDPDMPRQLPANVRSGSVLVRFTVQPDGRVVAPEVVQTTNQRMSASALEAVLQWRFAPVSQARIATVEVGFSRD